MKKQVLDADLCRLAAKVGRSPVVKMELPSDMTPDDLMEDLMKYGTFEKLPSHKQDFLNRASLSVDVAMELYPRAIALTREQMSEVITETNRRYAENQSKNSK